MSGFGDLSIGARTTFILKLDSNGNTIWSKSYSVSQHDFYLRSLRQTGQPENCESILPFITYVTVSTTFEEITERFFTPFRMTKDDLKK